jgi:hypothetical protein
MSMTQFRSLLRIIEALPEKVPNDCSLRDVMPGAWPTVGDLRRLVNGKQQRPDSDPREPESQGQEAGTKGD